MDNKNEVKNVTIICGVGEAKAEGVKIATTIKKIIEICEKEKYFDNDELNDKFFEDKELGNLLKYCVDGFASLNRIPKKKFKPKKLKNTKLASVPVSAISGTLLKEHTTNEVDISKNSTKATIQTDYGVIKLENYVPDEFDFNMSQEEILNIHKSIKLSREALQIFYALLSTYMTNVPNSKYGIGYVLTFKQLHEDVLGRSKKDRLREEDVKYYNDIFSYLSCKRVSWSSNGATKAPFNAKRLRKKTFENSNLILINTKYNDDEQTFEIVPTPYTLFEIKDLKQITNHFPKGFLTLDFDRHENIFYFGYYLSRVHRISKDKDYCREMSFSELIMNSLPNGQKLLQEIIDTPRKKEVFERKILKHFKDALEIMKKDELIKKAIIPEINLATIKKILANDEIEKVKIYYNFKLTDNIIKAFE